MTLHRLELVVNEFNFVNTNKRALRKRPDDYLLYRLRTYYNLRKKNQIIKYANNKKSISL
jgi:hypothetical protein